MATVAEAFAQALQYHQAGVLPQAEQLYRQILAVDPTHSDSLHLLGVLAYQQGRSRDAVPLIERALTYLPQVPAIHNNLGAVYQALGRKEEALAQFREASRLQPDYADAHNNLGNLLQEMGQLETAIWHCREALRLQPSFSEALNNLGNAYQRLGKLTEAVDYYRQAIALKPMNPEPHNNLGVVLNDLEQPAQAVEQFREALRLKPDYADAYNNWGNALRSLGRLDEAIACYRRALELQPDYAESCTNLGSALRDQGKLNEAVACHEQALRLNPRHADACNNLGSALRAQGKNAEALAYFEQAMHLQANHADAHWNRALVWLHQGDYERGWPEYEWRWRTKSLRERTFSQPRWDGSPLAGRTILIYAEQGLGDTLQFIRYAPLMKKRGGQVIIECQPVLEPLLAGCRGIDHLIPAGSSLPAFDVQMPLLSLPGIFRTTLETIPAEIPYLFPPRDRTEYWGARVAALPGLRIGIAWQGSPQHKGDRQRSFPLVQFEKLARLPGVQLISLQKGPGREQIPAVAGRVPVIELDSGASFLESAALMANLDLVITVDSAPAHLAGALGLPVWIPLPYVADFRWLENRPDSPWYRTVRLFRQVEPGNWAEVFDRMVQALAEWRSRTV
jgi:tetratricopeptide (TPR) repeat protein